jgi:hypothetical protein
MSAAAKEPWELMPDPAIAAVLTHRGPVLLDLDETLYLRNSTEDFIDSARPALLALLVLRALDLFEPWRLTGGIETRDVWRVRCVMVLFPWTGRYWDTRVRALAARWANTPLIDAVNRRAESANHSAPIITTFGFHSVVKPLVAALGLPPTRIVAARTSTFADRRSGKFRMVVAALGNETVRRALVLTDSSQDDELLRACAVPLRKVWPEARFRPALSGHYLPGQYLSQVKRPGERYITHGILQEDFALWVLSSVMLAPRLVPQVAALLFLLLSFWAIYERGYVDNDRIAARFEPDPRLSDAFREGFTATPRSAPWVWAAVSGAIGVTILHGFGSRQAIAAFGVWSAVLVGTYGAFWIYNRFDKSTRVWLYPGLQVARSAAFVALVPINLIGAVAISAHVLAKWVPYSVYRAQDAWPDSSHLMTRLLFFVVLLVLIAFALGFSSIWTWSTALLLAWNLIRARHELVAILLGASRLDRAESK